MKLSTRGRYGIRALIELAMREDKNPVALKDIAQCQEISLQYLEHLITPLIAGGVLKSTRGARGGVILARPAKEITLSQILRILEGSTAPVDCLDKPQTCTRSEKCAAFDFWAEVKSAVDNVLDKTTLADIVERQRYKNHLETPMYYI
ncbi:MAG: Rrf2 family transcriptional regulator [Dehalococcoidales bacterium]|nr:Rrf2 family transcriptional regulator [Dehalococcoidales bacterium]